jgi:hypothetical protein
MDGHQLVLSKIWSRSRRAKNLTTGIWLIFRGLNFSRNADIGQIGHLWMGTIYFFADFLTYPSSLRPLMAALMKDQSPGE